MCFMVTFHRERPNNYLMCSEAHMVEMGLETNFLRSTPITAYLDTELTQNFVLLELQESVVTQKSAICTVRQIRSTGLF